MTTRRLRICMVAYYMPPLYSGAARQALTLASRLRDRCEFQFVTARHDASPPRDRLDGFPITRLGACGKGWLFQAVFALHLAWWLWRHRAEYDLVHAHGYPPLYFIALAVLRLCRKPNLQKVSMAGHDDPATLFAGRLGWVRRLAHRWITVKIAPSTAVRDLCLQVRSPAVGRVAYIPNGVDTERFQPAPLPATEPIGLYVGSISSRKGVEDLLRIWTRVVQQVPAAQLWLIGPQEHVEHGGRRTGGDRYVKLVKELGLADHVKFFPPQTDVVPWMQRARVFCLATKREGMPNVLLEAAACGLPAVAFEAEGVADIIQQGRSGFCVALGQYEHFADRVVELFKNPQQWAEMAAAARAHALQYFDLDGIAERYHRLYRELAG